MATKKLTPAQVVALSRVSAADAAWRQKKLTAEAEAKRIVEEAIEGLAAERAAAVREAVNLGVPKARVGKEGLHSGDPAITNRVLNDTAEVAALTGLRAFSWIDPEHQSIRVRYPEFPTTNPDPNYPSLLSGILHKEGAHWVVVQDDSDQVTDFGNLPGFLYWEAERTLTPSNAESHLLTMVNEWAAGTV